MRCPSRLGRHQPAHSLVLVSSPSPVRRLGCRLWYLVQAAQGGDSLQ